MSPALRAARRRNVLRWLAAALAAPAISALAGGCDLNSLLKQGSGKKTAIVYGVNIYDAVHTAKNLRYCVSDATGFGGALAAKGWNVMTQTDANASKAQLATDIATVAASAEAGQRVLFYYSGHGHTIPAGQSYAGEWIMPYGSVIYTSDYYLNMSNAINPAQLATMLQPLIDKRCNVVVVLDSCYSGGFVANGSYSSDLPADYGTTPYLGGSSLGDSSMLFATIADYFSGGTQSGALSQPNVWVLSAAGSGEESFEDPSPTGSVQHGYFTYGLIHAVDSSGGRMNADYNGDGYVTLQELYRYSKETVDGLWNKYNYANYGTNTQYLPHLSGNPLDILIYH